MSKGSDKGKAKGLFSAWYELELSSGLTQAEILRRLNETCGTKYKSNWISQQQGCVQGLTRTPPQVRRYMMGRVLEDRLAKHGIKKAGVCESILDDLV